MATRGVVVLGFFVTIACGSSTVPIDDAGGLDAVVKHDASGVEADVAPPPPPFDAGFPGPHPAPPQVQNYGGPVLTTPTVIPIFFPSDSYQSQLETFLGQVAASTFWASATLEYGAGPLTIGTSIVVTDTPPGTPTVSEIEAWLVSYLDGTHSEFPPVALNNIYVIFYPTSTTITDPSLGTSCVDFGGYHSEAKSTTNQSIVYAVLPRCPSFGTLTGLDALTGPVSHELIEASTDPLGSNPAWVVVDTDHMVWNIRPLGEIGDMCAYEPQSYQRLVDSFVVQRPWSNASALAGHDPCVPVLTQPYFASAPVLTDSVMLDYYGQEIATKGVQVPLNQSKTIDVQLFSDGPVANWTVQAVDANYGTANPAELTFSWDASSGNNGDTLHLTITRIANGNMYQGTEFFVYAQRNSSDYNMWFGFAGN